MFIHMFIFFKQGDPSVHLCFFMRLAILYFKVTMLESFCKISVFILDVI